VQGSGAEDTDATVATTWPMVVPLGRPSQQALNTAFAEPNRWAIRWRDTAAEHGLALRWQDRTVNGSRQPMPTHLILEGPQAVVDFVGGAWADTWIRSRHRWVRLVETFPTTATPAVLRGTISVDDATFDLLLSSAAWLAANDTTGLTARQVPIEGTHAKWLQAHHAVLRTLSGKPLVLASRPTRIGFTYLDPAHRAAGGRRHDSYTLGDTAPPAYSPSVAIISENKDTAVLFPEVLGGISIEGNGDAAARQLPEMSWLLDVPRLLYWGDIDADGFEIVNSLRAAGLAVDTILMDLVAYKRYEPYGTWTDKTGKVLPASTAKTLVHLTDAERAVYQAITDPAWHRVRRIEQERIGLGTARDAVLAAFAESRVLAGPLNEADR
jgi:hypothetical protein